jgi:hypothetical protein
MSVKRVQLIMTPDWDFALEHFLANNDNAVALRTPVRARGIPLLRVPGLPCASAAKSASTL